MDVCLWHLADIDFGVELCLHTGVKRTSPIRHGNGQCQPTLQLIANPARRKQLHSVACITSDNFPYQSQKELDTVSEQIM